jgi:ribosomal 50S subunit-recycling heat shock protein
VARTDMMLKMENIFKRDSWTKYVRKTGNVEVKSKQTKYNTKTKNTNTTIL